MTTGAQGTKAFGGHGNFPHQFTEPFNEEFVYFSMYYLSKDSASEARRICKSCVKIVFSFCGVFLKQYFKIGTPTHFTICFFLY